MKPAGEENDLKPLLVTPGSEPAQNQLCPLGEESASVPQNEKMSGNWKPSGNNSYGFPGVGDGSWTSLVLQVRGGHPATAKSEHDFQSHRLSCHQDKSRVALGRSSRFSSSRFLVHNVEIKNHN